MICETTSLISSNNSYWGDLLINIINEPTGKAYFRLLDYLLKTSDKFSLTVHNQLRKYNRVYDILEALDDYLIEVVSEEDFLFNGYSEGKVYIYKFTSESLEILKKSTNRLYQWQHPRLPEDLCFFDKDWNIKLITVAHEGMNGLVVSDETERLYVVNDVGIQVGP
jgi:hypothetical protein